MSHAQKAGRQPLKHVRERAGVAGIARERERLLGERSPALVVGIELELHRLKRDQPRAAGGIREAVELERPLERQEALLVDLAVDAHLPAVVGERGAGGAIGIAELEGETRGLEQGLSESGLADLTLGLAEADQKIARSEGSTSDCWP